MNIYNPKKALIYLGVLSIVVLLVSLAYWPSLHGPMIFDDIQNIVQNPNVAIKNLSISSLEQALLSNESGQLKRMIPALSFGLNHYFSGGFADTWAFKLTNLIIHILNSGLLMTLLFLLWPHFKLSTPSSKNKIILPIALVTLLWALHPLHISTVAYVVQRMTSMAATFVLLGLCVFIYGRQLLERQFQRGMFFMTLGVVLGSALGLLCKENAALLSIYAGVIEWTLFKREKFFRKQKWGLIAFYTIFLVIPLCLAFIYFFVYPGNLIASYGGRAFSLSERLWTEARVLWFYLYLLFIPDISNMGLFHDDIATSHGWLQPISTLLSIIAWIILLIGAVLLRNRLPVFAFSVLWYLLGHSMESSFIPLELVYEHRNYLPSIGIVILFCSVFIWCFDALFCKSQNNLLKHYGLIALAGILVTGVLYAARLRADYWKDERSIFTSMGKNHPESAISQYLYGEVLFRKDKQVLQAYPHYFKAAQLNQGEVAFLVMAVLTTPVEIISNLKDEKSRQTFSNKHIVNLILNRPLSPWSLTIFDSAGLCVLSRHNNCLPHVNNVIIWLQAVIKSKYVPSQYKKQYIQQLYNIQIVNGMPDAALKTTLAAIAKYGRAFQYFLMRADALQALGKYKEALIVLKEIEFGVRGRRPDLLAKVQQMQKIILRKYQTKE